MCQKEQTFEKRRKRRRDRVNATNNNQKTAKKKGNAGFDGVSGSLFTLKEIV